MRQAMMFSKRGTSSAEVQSLIDAAAGFDWIESVPSRVIAGVANTAANQAYYYRVRPTKSFRSTKITIYAGSPATGTIDLGISQYAGGTMTKLVATGSTAIGAINALQSLTLAFDWVAGADYWLSLATSDAVALARYAGVGALLAHKDESLTKATAFPLADQSSLGTTSNIFWIRASAT